ncbi:MAG: glycosyltransferase family 4 [Treponematales bacterium]
MKLLQIIDLYKTGGAEKVYDLFYQYCVQAGHDVKRIVLYGGVDDGKRYLIKQESGSLIQKCLDQARAVWLLRRVIKSEQTERVVSFLDRSNLAAILACFLSGTKSGGRPPVTVTVHNPPTVQYLKLKSPLRELFFFVLAFAYNRRHVKTIAVSAQIKEALERIGVRNVETVYNPFDFSRIKPAGANQGSHERYIVAAGRLEYQKAHWKLLRAFCHYKHNFDSGGCKLYIFGSGSLEHDLKRLTKDLGIEDSVVFFGYVSNVMAYIRGARGMVFSSFYEGFPISLLECMALERPFVGSDGSIPPEIRSACVENGIANTYRTESMAVDFGTTVGRDEMDLARLIHKMETDQVFAGAVAETGRKWMRDHCPLSNFDRYLS